ncbi:hypothetical protein HOC13_04395 [Candidatus Woesearchaeota archaeon]|nr:hypothetical protein [Candidatus Woesearchaeota archaeon]
MAGTEIVKRSSDLVEPLQTSGENYVGTFTLQQSVGWPRYNFYVDADMDVFLTLKIIEPSFPHQEVYFRTEGSDLVNVCLRKRDFGSNGGFVYSDPSPTETTYLDPVLRTAFDPNVSIEEMINLHCLMRSQNYRAHSDAIDKLMDLGGIGNGR